MLFCAAETIAPLETIAFAIRTFKESWDEKTHSRTDKIESITASFRLKSTANSKIIETKK